MFVVLPRLLPAVLSLVAVVPLVPSRSVPVGAVAPPSMFASPTEPPSAVIDEPWQPPVDAPIVDYFRAPTHRYGPGNRGLEYGTRRGQAVCSVAAGVVVFAGRVGGRLFVVVSHGPDLRSTYAYLHSIAVSEGDDVTRGQRLAAAATGFHLTARHHGRYIDPLPLFGWRYRLRLVAPGTGPTSALHWSGEGGIPPRRAL